MNRHHTFMDTRKSGFTVVEMSIVVVIVGLVLGGIFVGRDLINSARIRAQIVQLDSYNLAVNAFRQKYDELPGDMLSTAASRFGFTARGGSNGHGDGDTLFEGCDPLGAGEVPVGCEVVLFWVDLYKAGLIPDKLTTATDADMVAANPEAVLNYLPKAKISDTGKIMISNHRQQGHGWFVINSIAHKIGATFALSFGVSPIKAYNIDVKLDNGNPLTGNVLATSFAPGAGGGGPFFQNPAQNINGCVFNNAYSISPANPNVNQDFTCHMSIRMQY